MKILIFATIVVGLILLTSCSTNNNSTPTTPITSTSSVSSGTILTGTTSTGMITTGTTTCAPGQIMADGRCISYSGTGTNSNLFARNPDASVTGSTITDGDLRGYYVSPTAPGDYPGVVMIHEWWGLNDDIRYMARLLAESGYRVFAIDLYNGQVATDATRASELAGMVRSNTGATNDKLKLAIEYLKEKTNVSKVGVLGWCFGGGQALNISIDTPVDATVIYYGNLVEDTGELDNLEGPVLGIFGDKDTSIPLEKINLFQKNLNDLGIENHIYIYPGLGHAFANPSGANYAPGETVDAWDKTTKFLSDNLKK